MSEISGLKPHENTLKHVVNTLHASQKILLTSHTSPDGDGVGGILALSSLLKNFDKEVTLYLEDPVPYNLRFLPDADKIVSSLSENASFDATCVIDTNSLSNVGTHLPSRKNLGTLIQIDHHKKQPDPFADIALIDAKSSSVGELMYQIAQKLSVTITKEIATQIYCSIFCDTGSFRYKSTNPEALRIAAKMIEYGVDPWEMTAEILESNPISRPRLLGEALRTLSISSDGFCASIVITQKMLKKTGASEELIDGFINFARGVSGVEVATQILEIEKNVYQVGFRSRGNVDVSNIAKVLGGGGHKNAAGCRLTGSPKSIQKQIFEETAKLCHQLTSSQ